MVAKGSWRREGFSVKNRGPQEPSRPDDKIPEEPRNSGQAKSDGDQDQVDKMERPRGNAGRRKRQYELIRVNPWPDTIILGDKGKKSKRKKRSKGEDESLLQEPWGSMIKIDGVSGPTRR